MSIFTVVLLFIISGSLIGTGVALGLGYITTTSTNLWNLITYGLTIMVMIIIIGAFM